MWVLKLKEIVGCAAPTLAVICLLTGCQKDDQSALEPEQVARTQIREWVAIEPTQCLSNAWEVDWLEQHGGDYAAYPKDPLTPGLEPEEIAIITS